MDSPSWNSRRGDTRASDAERDPAVAELSEHFQAGRLTREEFEDRSGRALQARTGGDPSVLFTDLPQNAVPVPAAPGPAAGPVPGLSPGGVRRPGRVPVARIVIVCVIALIIAGSALGDTGHSNGHASFGWLVPVVVAASFSFTLPAADVNSELTESSRRHGYLSDDSCPRQSPAQASAANAG